MTTQFFPPNIPIMTDVLFTNLGGFTGTSTALQRDFAYRIAEAKIAEEIGTYLVPTTVTGSFPNVTPNNLIQLPVGKLISVNSVFLHERWSNGIERVISGTSYITDYENGYIMIDISPNDASACIGCSGQNEGIYKATISYTAGYATGLTVSSPEILLGLYMVTSIILPQMYDEGLGFEYHGFEKTTQIGRSIISLSDKFILDTAFGSSVKANYIRTLLRNYKIGRAGRLGR